LRCPNKSCGSLLPSQKGMLLFLRSSKLCCENCGNYVFRRYRYTNSAFNLVFIYSPFIVLVLIVYEPRVVPYLIEGAVVSVCAVLLIFLAELRFGKLESRTAIEERRNDRRQKVVGWLLAMFLLYGFVAPLFV